mmetsp:Transcript_68192/g.177004  ORF Transcript_68192/g.177004 Transcript_68192/m.177004 type:complete len:793 (+) Transcript_68192:34-2412(+)
MAEGAGSSACCDGLIAALENIWARALSHLSLKSALALQLACRSISCSVMANGRLLQWGCRVRPFIGTDATAKSLRTLRQYFPLLRELRVSLFSKCTPIPSEFETCNNIAQLGAEEQLELMTLFEEFEKHASTAAVGAAGLAPTQSELDSMVVAAKLQEQKMKEVFAKAAMRHAAQAMGQRNIRGTVTLCDLNSRSDLNGQIGEILSYNETKDRYVVKLTRSQESFLAKLANINVGSPADVITELSGLRHLESLTLHTDIVMQPPSVYESIGRLPFLMQLEITGHLCDFAVREIAMGCAGLRKLSLRLHGSVGDEGLESIASCVLLTNLTLAGLKNTDAVLSRVIFACARLTSVDFWEMAVGAETFRSIATNSILEDLCLRKSSDGSWAVEFSTVTRACQRLKSVTFSNRSGLIDFSEIQTNQSVQVLHLENQPFNVQSLASLRGWANLKRFDLYCYGPPFVTSVLAALVMHAPSLQHVAKVVLCALSGDFPPYGPHEVIEKLREVWSSHCVQYDQHSVAFHLREVQNTSPGVQDEHRLIEENTTQEQPVALARVLHEETAAVVDEEVAQTEVSLQWAEMVQRRIQDDHSRENFTAAVPSEIGAGSLEESTEVSVEEKVHILRFGCNATEEFRELLLFGPHMRFCRDALESEGFSCVLPSGALIFVMPEQFDEVRRQLIGFHLHPFHVVISSRFECDLEHALASLPYKKRPREKVKDRRQLDPLETAPVAEVAIDSVCDDPPEQYELCEERTFLCICPCLRRAEDVVQSTTEVVTDSQAHYAYARGRNPRRLV